MCRGRIQEEKDQKQQEMVVQVSSPHPNTQVSVSCELCGLEASLYCQADDAYLCRKCDRHVHNANFLAQRHIRCLLCTSCHGFTQKYLIGNSLELLLPSLVGTDGNRCNKPDDGSCTNHHGSFSWEKEEEEEEEEEEDVEEEIKLPFLFL